MIKKLNWTLIVTMTTLLIIGLVNLYSVSHQSDATVHLFYLQLTWIAIGFCCFFLISFIHYHFLIRTAYIIYAINLISLVAVNWFGTSFGGAQRWLDFGLFFYQPAETMKLALILVLARILSAKRSWQVMNFTELVKPILLIAFPIFFIFRQPDLGTALITLIVMASIIVFAKVRKSVLLSFVGLLLCITPIVWNFGLKNYQKNRIVTFISPTRDPRGTGYNIIQSKIAIGSGQFLGKGFQKGTQSQLKFLPERYTDFIFSVLSEEHGFLGSIITILLFLFLISLGFYSAFQARDKEGVFLCVGMSFYLFWHVLVNIGMTMGLLPVVGISLPLLSYGGSGLLTTMIALGVISSVSYRKYLF